MVLIYTPALSGGRTLKVRGATIKEKKSMIPITKETKFKMIYSLISFSF